MRDNLYSLIWGGIIGIFLGTGVAFTNVFCLFMSVILSIVALSLSYIRKNKLSQAYYKREEQIMREYGLDEEDEDK